MARPGRTELGLLVLKMSTTCALYLACSLMVACYAGHLSVIHLLHEKGVQWTQKDKGGKNNASLCLIVLIYETSRLKITYHM